MDKSIEFSTWKILVDSISRGLTSFGVLFTSRWWISLLPKDGGRLI